MRFGLVEGDPVVDDHLPAVGVPGACPVELGDDRQEVAAEGLLGARAYAVVLGPLAPGLPQRIYGDAARRSCGAALTKERGVNLPFFSSFNYHHGWLLTYDLKRSGTCYP